MKLRPAWWLTVVGALLYESVLFALEWAPGAIPDALTRWTWAPHAAACLLLAVGMAAVFARTDGFTERVFSVVGIVGFVLRAVTDALDGLLPDKPAASAQNLSLSASYTLSTQLIALGTIGVGLALWRYRHLAVPLVLSGFTLQLVVGLAWLASEYLDEDRPLLVSSAAMVLFYLWFGLALRHQPVAESARPIGEEPLEAVLVEDGNA